MKRMKKSNVVKMEKQDVELNRESLAQKNILDSLMILKLAYDVAILEKTSLSQQLEFERKNIENLMEIINASKNPSTEQIHSLSKTIF